MEQPTTAALVAALRITHPEYCSMRCPSHFTSPEQPRHTPECARIAALICDEPKPE